MPILMIILAIVAVLILVGVGAYNKYIRLKNLNEEGWSGIEVYLQKRLDLIPNLVNTVKGYAAHEKETLENVVRLRSQMMSIDTKDIENIEKIQKLENEMTKTLRSIMMLQENYPDLKANENFISLQSQLSQIESEIQNSRKYYNGTARDRNTFVETFPNNILGGFLGFKKAEFFNAAEGAERAPEVKF
ncbi:LemA family protein [Pseudoleptotrichia goodfellowii]|uniref:LemA family protein n=1 Tax=Pseudoleptotrichia goodfellowii F0264 TaxID=596323 RepID=D0GP87_9FUSO|nr:LemA family protein [Pseudoleptotrichia goodfellowii]EEY34083.1 LemA family protein [Pseudoleptotrichia goodfellowii F0264]MBF4805234.1 LemA family protein [Pseudoleptotrichia goodfellowii]